MNDKYEILKKTAQTQEEAFTRLVDVLNILRVECPWDKAQKHSTLTACMIEEAYEVCEAINNEDDENMREELGDVLLQVLFHSMLAKERNAFQLTDVINDECEKMIRRHPHVFEETDAKSVDKVMKKWENIKSKEHYYENTTEVLEDVPQAFPALIRSMKIQKKAADVGFDWDDIQYVYDKVEEETEEVKYATKNEGQKEVEGEIGDLLFSVVNLARFLNVNPEEALNKTNKKFISRFSFVEKATKESGKNMEDMTLEELDAFWEESKLINF